jgi:serine protease Do
LSPAQARDAGLAARGAVLVTEALVAGRAAAAGVRSGDILMAVGGEDVNDAAALEERLASWPAGIPLPLRVWRDGRAWDLVLHTVPAAR